MKENARRNPRGKMQWILESTLTHDHTHAGN